MLVITAHHYGMVQTKYRTSFALDQITIERLRQLAVRWNISQAEVVRRAVERMAQQDSVQTDALRRRLGEYRAQGTLAAETAEQYLSEVAAARAEWERGL